MVKEFKYLSHLNQLTKKAKKTSNIVYGIRTKMFGRDTNRKIMVFDGLIKRKVYEVDDRIKYANTRIQS